jgi:ABC-type amino acid transport system permease subunit
MLNLLRSGIHLVKSKKGNAFAWVIIALIIAIAIIVSVVIYTNNQTHPVWEVK